MFNNVRMLSNMLSRETVFFVGIFAVAFVLQAVLWETPLPYVDGSMWFKASHTLSLGILPAYPDPTPPHPGTTIIVPAAGLLLLPFHPFTIFNVTMALLISLAIAATCLVARFLRPNSLWWLGIAVLLIPDALFMDMTPPSAFAAAMTALSMLLVLVALEKGLSKEVAALLGASCGILIATRIDTGGVVLAAALILLSFKIKREIVLVPIFSLAYFLALDPYIWADPIGHILTVMNQVGSNVSIEHGIADAYGGKYLALLSFGLGCAYVVGIFKNSPVPKKFLAWLILVSVTFTALVLMQEYHPLRYFFPFIVTWEVLLPLFIFDSLENHFGKYSWRLLRIEYAFLVLFLIARVTPIVILLT